MLSSTSLWYQLESLTAVQQPKVMSNAGVLSNIAWHDQSLTVRMNTYITGWMALHASARFIVCLLDTAPQHCRLHSSAYHVRLLLPWNTILTAPWHTNQSCHLTLQLYPIVTWARALALAAGVPSSCRTLPSSTGKRVSAVIINHCSSNFTAIQKLHRKHHSATSPHAQCDDPNGISS